MFRMAFRTDNDAFQEDPEVEVARILGEIRWAFATGGETAGVVRDVNGNVVGEYSLTVEEVQHA